MKFIHLLLVALLFTLFGSSLFAEKPTIFTEEFSPFNESKKGQIIGVSTEIIEPVMKKSGIEYAIKSLPWTRTCKISQAKPNSFIYLFN